MSRVYDAMHLIYEALKKTGGNTNGDALIAAMKGMAWESPRGRSPLDPDTREMIQYVYIRHVERVNGELYNVEFDKHRSSQGSLQSIANKIAVGRAD